MSDVQQRLESTLARLDAQRCATAFRSRVYRAMVAAFSAALCLVLVVASGLAFVEAFRMANQTPGDPMDNSRLVVSIVEASQSIDGAEVCAEVRNASGNFIGKYFLDLAAYSAEGKYLGQARSTGKQLSVGESQQASWTLTGVDASEIDRYETTLVQAQDAKRKPLGRYVLARLE